MSEPTILQELKLLRERINRIESILEFIMNRLLPEEEMGGEVCKALKETMRSFLAIFL